MFVKSFSYVICFVETKYMSFLMKDENNRIWYKVSNFMKKWFNSEPVYNEKYFKN